MSLDRWVKKNPEHRMPRAQTEMTPEDYRKRIRRILESNQNQLEPGAQLAEIDVEAITLLENGNASIDELKRFSARYQKYQRFQRSRQARKHNEHTKIKVPRSERIAELNRTPEPDTLRGEDLRTRAELSQEIAQLRNEIAGLRVLLRPPIDPSRIVKHIPETPQLPLFYLGQFTHGGHLMQYGATPYIVSEEGYFLSYDPLRNTFLAYNTRWFPVFEQDAQPQGQDRIYFTYVNSLPEDLQQQFHEQYEGVDTYTYELGTGMPFVLDAQNRRVDINPEVYGKFTPQVTFVA